ncbi:CHAT domain-containing tetratricopeptide repeat protein [Nostoc sp. FACHB-280]|uniref:CHAT domain-containing tetratricopeptide repeat protein n=1 Tax=Nostoc sp. FACHB-280 TaxID=2692839 RepID=UPI0028C47082|nr:CHAT domain-containing tetratricopeptide repeat protein [Nostoc sp. FACHB-280]
MKKLFSAINAAGVCLTPWIMVAGMTPGLLLSMPVKGMAQQQTPTYSAEQQAALKEAEELNQQVTKLYQEGKYSTAIPLAERVLAIREKVLGQENLSVATTLNNLATLYQAQGEYQQAEPLYLRSLAIKEKLLGNSHREIATSLDNLALLYRKQGKYEQAEPLHLRALAIYEKIFGKEHPDVAISLNNLAGLYRLQGRFKQAEPLYLRSLAIYEKLLGNSHPDFATILDNLGLFYDLQGKYEQGESLHLRALAIYEKVFGKEHPDIAITLNNLAASYNAQGKFAKAEPLYFRALAISEKILGKSHPDVANKLDNLAALYSSQGKYEQAEVLHLRALAIFEKVLGKQHPDVAISLTNLASLYQAKGDIVHAVDFERRGLEIQAKNLDLIFAVGSEKNKQDYIKTFAGTTDATVSLALQEAKKNPAAASLALITVLRRKGLVLDAVADSIQILRSKLDKNPETQNLFTQWLQIQQQLSALVFSRSTQQTANPTEQIGKLEAEKEKLEAKISVKSAEFRQQIQPVDLFAVQAKIPQDAALLEIVQYKPFNVKATTEAEKFSKPHYAVAVLRSQGQPKWVDLGEAAEIDKLAIDFRTALAIGTGFKKLARTLDEKLIAPIRPFLGDARHILISPDGQLTLIPFEALKDEQDQFLIQRYSFSYLTTGRDLLRFQSNASNATAPVVLADIDYDYQNQTVASNKKPSVQTFPNKRSSDLATLEFLPLAATKYEAIAIKKVLPNAKLLLGKNATETAVKKLHSPVILHLATHGFFIADIAQNINASLDLPEKPNQEKILAVENPLLRSGLALAGANKRNQVTSGDDGILTALEVAGLDLRSNQLVVLSACETGRGDVKVGDGVYGLRRALVIAGSQTQVLSLWLVDDAATKDLMAKYYQNLQAGKGRHEALRAAQLDLLKTEEYQHPRFWAAFVPSGNWTPLREK